ncbi:hypothetical protein D9M70_397130 [compost metagenome]
MRELLEIGKDQTFVHQSGAEHRIDGLLVLPRRAHENAAAELLVPDRSLQEIEGREKTLIGIVRALLDKDAHLGAGLFVAPLKCGQDKILFGFKMPIERRLGHPRLGDEEIDAGRVVTVQVEQAQSGIEQMTSDL